jgi:hypothetical protein
MNPVLRRSIHVLILSSIISSSPARTWTDANGRKLEGTLVASDDREIVIRLENGKNVTIPLIRLSQADHEEDEDEEEDREDTPAAEKEPAEPLENFDAPWPDNVRFDEDPGVQVVTEDAENKEFVYESMNYRFICDVRLSKQVVNGFSVMFEATHDYCRALPLGLSGGARTDGKYRILLFETKASYIKAGGPPDSAGVFISGRNVVMVPLSSLGVRRVGSGYMLDRDQSSGTLIHEITHQLTPRAYYSDGAMGWFSEGIAEYTTATPYRNGRFKVKSNFDDIVAYATAFGKDDNDGRGLGTAIEAPALKEFFLMDYDEFTDEDANFNYGFGLLLTTYFLHLDGDGDAARMKEFLKALRTGEESQDALDVLMAGRDYAEMEEAIAKGWKRKGIDIEFASPASAGDD